MTYSIFAVASSFLTKPNFSVFCDQVHKHWHSVFLKAIVILTWGKFVLWIQNKRRQAAGQDNLFSLICIKAEVNSQNQDNGYRSYTEIKGMTRFTTIIKCFSNTKKHKKYIFFTYRVIMCLKSNTVYYSKYLLWLFHINLPWRQGRRYKFWHCVTTGWRKLLRHVTTSEELMLANFIKFWSIFGLWLQEHPD